MDLFADSDAPLRLGEVAERAGLSRPTAYQRLLTLVEAGMVEVDDRQRYRLSLYPARLMRAALQQAGIGQRAEAIMTRLMQATGETVSLAVLQRDEACIVARVETSALLRADQTIGSAMPLQGSASGRVLAAFASAQQLAQIEAGHGAVPDLTLLEQARRDGYAVSSGYSHSGVIGIASPVFAADGSCSGALSLVIPEQRYRLNLVLQPLKAAAAELSTSFGYRP